MNDRLDEIVNKKLHDLEYCYQDDGYSLNMRKCHYTDCEATFPINNKTKNRKFCRTHTKIMKKEKNEG